MQKQLVVTFIGPDRPGLIEAISEIISNAGGSWLESRMSNLAGKFAGIALVAIPGENLPELRTALTGLEDASIRIMIETTADSTEDTGPMMRLGVIGNDRPGIVHEIAQALANRHINVVEMRSDISSAPMSGETLFSAKAEIQLPLNLNLDHLVDELDDIANELTIEYTLEAFNNGT